MYIFTLYNEGGVRVEQWRGGLKLNYIMDLTCITYNVRGIREDKKRREIFHYLAKKKFQIIFLQETHSTEMSISNWKIEWGTKIWAAHGDNKSKGVVILFARDLKVEVHNISQLEDGRCLILYVTINDNKFLLVNIYGPNEDIP